MGIGKLEGDALTPECHRLTNNDYMGVDDAQQWTGLDWTEGVRHWSKTWWEFLRTLETC